jgi:hypothetical protein
MQTGIVAYLRNLAARCSKLANDCSNPRIKGSLGAISVELAEKVEALEIDFQVPKNVHT